MFSRAATVLIGTLALLLAACASPSAPATDPASASASVDPAAFPLTLPQQGGSVTIERPPERVFVVDNWGLDLVVELGMKPVGVASYFPPSPWLAAKPELSGVEVTTITDAMPMEKIAAARPDLIVDISGYTATDPAVRDQLRKLAPVLYSPIDTNTDGWRDRLRHIASALGRSAAAEDSIAAAERTLDGIEQKFPDLKGAPLTFARFDPPATFAIVADDADFSRRFLNEELGFTTPTVQQQAYDGGRLQKAGGVIEGVSLERLDLLDGGAAAAFIWFQDDKNLRDLERQTVWRTAPFVAEGRLVPMDIDAAIALRTPTPASIAWMTEELLPGVAAAIAKQDG